jgi:hypothetical protein
VYVGREYEKKFFIFFFGLFYFYFFVLPVRLFFLWLSSIKFSSLLCVKKFIFFSSIAWFLNNLNLILFFIFFLFTFDSFTYFLMFLDFFIMIIIKINLKK